MKLRDLTGCLALTLPLFLSACGGGSQEAATTSRDSITLSEVITSSSATTSNPDSTKLGGSVPAAMATNAVASPAMTQAQASRLLMQASFGPTMESINAAAAMGAPAWVEDQFSMPQASHLVWMDNRPMPAGTPVSVNQFLESFWRQARLGQDQLRQRVTFALSQIFVVSFADGNVYSHPRGVASYYDILGNNAFGNFRQLLQSVATHPMMGVYLTYLRNQKEEGDRRPDENFAREIMQLMTIGLYQLNQDGTVKTSNGKPIETYTSADVAGLAKVFTGWSWYGPDRDVLRFYGTKFDPSGAVRAMQNYPAFHSTSEKKFLGVTLGGTAPAADELKVALDTLFNHPNVGPFFGRQMIQRMVTSNPSPAYVGRVAAAFNNNGSGVRGDMKAVIRAILLDPEARVVGTNAKLREPVLRLANWMRAFNAKSDSGYFRVEPMEDVLTDLGQTPMRANSVFNFYRPSYTPPNSALAASGMLSPEMQISSEPEVTGYLNYMQQTVQYGFGRYSDIKPDYTAENALIMNPAAMVDRLNLLLYSGNMSTQLRTQLIGAMNGVVIEDPRPWNGTVIAKAKRNRVFLPVFLAMASPEYLVQK